MDSVLGVIGCISQSRFKIKFIVYNWEMLQWYRWHHVHFLTMIARIQFTVRCYTQLMGRA